MYALLRAAWSLCCVGLHVSRLCARRSASIPRLAFARLSSSFVQARDGIVASIFYTTTLNSEPAASLHGGMMDL
ncbi:hypothetical protein, partial [Pseudomonas amygdali]|uniref:hypothetical protein n=1 Tax=Pseudomonas amygdali TaxID=47877 RepID=UPI001F285A6A